MLGILLALEPAQDEEMPSPLQHKANTAPRARLAALVGL